MFYEVKDVPRSETKTARIKSAIITLTSAESKRLIAKAVAVLPEVKAAMKKGYLIISWGTTNAMVAEEITGKKIPRKADYASGVVSEGRLNACSPDKKIFPFVFRDGKLTDIHPKNALQEFMPGDVFIKGANALDVKGNIGILAANAEGGSIAQAWFAISGRGGCFICPVGLEKAILSSVEEAADKCGMYRFSNKMDSSASLVTLNSAKVVTEVQAIEVLTGAAAFHVSSGGIAGSEGAVTLAIEGTPAVIKKALMLIKSVKGEPAITPPSKYTYPRQEL